MKDTGNIISTNFGKGGMKKITDDYQISHAVAFVEAATYIAKLVEENKESKLRKEGDTVNVWSYAVKGKMSREDMLRIATTIRATTGWDDPMDTMLVHAYMAKNNHEAFVEGK